MELSDLQMRFLQAILSGDDAVLPDIAEAGGISPAGRLEIYRNNVFSACAKALALTYPCVEQLVGEAFFRQLAEEFTRAHPPTGGNLDDFGQELATFLQDYAPAASVPYLPEMARLEWLMQEAALAGKGTSIDVSALASIPPEKYFNVRLRLHPSVRLLHSAYPLHRIRAFCLEDAEKPDLAVEGRVWLMAVRPYRRTELAALNPADFAFMQAVAGGAGMEDAYHAAIAADEGFDLAQCIQLQLSLGALGGFSLAVQ